MIFFNLPPEEGRAKRVAYKVRESSLGVATYLHVTPSCDEGCVTTVKEEWYHENSKVTLVDEFELEGANIVNANEDRGGLFCQRCQQWMGILLTEVRGKGTKNRKVVTQWSAPDVRRLRNVKGLFKQSVQESERKDFENI